MRYFQDPSSPQSFVQGANGVQWNLGSGLWADVDVAVGVAELRG